MLFCPTVSMRVPMFTNLGLYLVGSLMICVRLLFVLISMSQFRSPNRTNSEARWGAINSQMVSRAQLGADGGR